MLTSKERAHLRGLGQKLEPVLQVGKEGITPACTKNADDVLTAQELIKVQVQKNCLTPVREIADTLSERTRSEVVQVIGRKFVLYRYSRTVKHHVPKYKENGLV